MSRGHWQVEGKPRFPLKGEPRRVDSCLTLPILGHLLPVPKESFMNKNSVKCVLPALSRTAWTQAHWFWSLSMRNMGSQVRMRLRVIFSAQDFRHIKTDSDSPGELEQRHLVAEPTHWSWNWEAEELRPNVQDYGCPPHSLLSHCRNTLRISLP